VLVLVPSRRRRATVAQEEVLRVVAPHAEVQVVLTAAMQTLP
jgi:hypothetical protein